MPLANTENRLDIHKRRIIDEIQGGVVTPSSANVRAVGSSPTTGQPLRRVRDGVVETAFTWFIHSFEDENVFFL